MHKSIENPKTSYNVKHKVFCHIIICFVNRNAWSYQNILAVPTCQDFGDAHYLILLAIVQNVGINLVVHQTPRLYHFFSSSCKQNTPNLPKLLQYTGFDLQYFDKIHIGFLHRCFWKFILAFFLLQAKWEIPLAYN